VRVVFDTNIFISALIFPGSQAEKAILKVIEGKDTLILSREIIKEVLSVLSKKFSKDREAISRVAVNLSEMGELIEASEKTDILEDRADNRILECAAAGNADMIITGDKAMLKLKRYGNTRIISLKEYLQ
jgi:putative PIN family toxin of toxin-antitoxin system